MSSKSAMLETAQCTNLSERAEASGYVAGSTEMDDKGRAFTMSMDRKERLRTLYVEPIMDYVTPDVGGRRDLLSPEKQILKDQRAKMSEEDFQAQAIPYMKKLYSEMRWVVYHADMEDRLARVEDEGESFDWAAELKNIKANCEAPDADLIKYCLRLRYGPQAVPDDELGNAGIAAEFPDIKSTFEMSEEGLYLAEKLLSILYIEPYNFIAEDSLHPRDILSSPYLNSPEDVVYCDPLLVRFTSAFASVGVLRPEVKETREDRLEQMATARKNEALWLSGDDEANFSPLAYIKNQGPLWHSSHSPEPRLRELKVDVGQLQKLVKDVVSAPEVSTPEVVAPKVDVRTEEFTASAEEAHEVMKDDGFRKWFDSHFRPPKGGRAINKAQEAARMFLETGASREEIAQSLTLPKGQLGQSLRLSFERFGLPGDLLGPAGPSSFTVSHEDLQRAMADRYQKVLNKGIELRMSSTCFTDAAGAPSDSLEEALRTLKTPELSDTDGAEIERTLQGADFTNWFDSLYPSMVIKSYNALRMYVQTNLSKEEIATLIGLEPGSMDQSLRRASEWTKIPGHFLGKRDDDLTIDRGVLRHMLYDQYRQARPNVIATPAVSAMEERPQLSPQSLVAQTFASSASIPEDQAKSILGSREFKTWLRSKFRNNGDKSFAATCRYLESDTSFEDIAKEIGTQKGNVMRYVEAALLRSGVSRQVMGDIKQDSLTRRDEVRSAIIASFTQETGLKIPSVTTRDPNDMESRFRDAMAANVANLQEMVAEGEALLEEGRGDAPGLREAG